MNLKPFYDAAMASVAAKQGIVQQIETLFAEDKKDEALAMQSQLDAAIAKAKADTEFYNSLLAASGDSDTPKNFVPAGAVTQQEQQDAKKVMARAAFDVLEPQAAMAFMKGGGKVVGEVSNG